MHDPNPKTFEWFERVLRYLERLQAPEPKAPEPPKASEPKPDPGPSFWARVREIFRRVIVARLRNAWPVAEVVFMASLGALTAQYVVGAAGFHAVGMVGVGVGVGAAAGSVALVLGAIIGLAIYGLMSLRRRLA